MEISTNPLSAPFAESLRSQSFNVDIVDDDDYESTEDFTVSLTLASVENFDSSRVTIDPNVATITITDDDGKCSKLLEHHHKPSVISAAF